MNDKEIEAAFEKLYKPPKRETYSGIRKEVWETCWTFHVKPLQADNKKLTVCQCSEMDAEFGIHCNSCVRDKLEKLKAENERLSKTNDSCHFNIAEYQKVMEQQLAERDETIEKLRACVTECLYFTSMRDPEINNHRQACDTVEEVTMKCLADMEGK
jgi:hypothetical protein